MIQVPPNEGYFCLAVSVVDAVAESLSPAGASASVVSSASSPQQDSSPSEQQLSELVCSALPPQHLPSPVLHAPVHLPPALHASDWVDSVVFSEAAQQPCFLATAVSPPQQPPHLAKAAAVSELQQLDSAVAIPSEQHLPFVGAA
jgi:hypothetical protein